MRARFVIACAQCTWVGDERLVGSANEAWFCPECGVDESGLVVYNDRHFINQLLHALRLRRKEGV